MFELFRVIVLLALLIFASVDASFVEVKTYADNLGPLCSGKIIQKEFYLLELCTQWPRGYIKLSIYNGELRITDYLDQSCITRAGLWGDTNVTLLMNEGLCGSIYLPSPVTSIANYIPSRNYKFAIWQNDSFLQNPPHGFLTQRYRLTNLPNYPMIFFDF